MRNFFSIFLIILAFVTMANSCKSANSQDDSTLPKDISERPADENSEKYDQALLDEMRTEIESAIAKEKCSKSSEWTFAPMGSKACGGPVRYIAYPKKMQDVIAPKISDYTQKMSDFNNKYNIVSDCMLAAEPTGVRCENGNAVFIY